MFTITREFRFEAAHRILGHSGKCKYIHGHSYRVVITVKSCPEVAPLNDLGMVADFADLKSGIGQWINDNLDHNIILHINDPLIEIYDAENSPGKVYGDQEPYLIHKNPTAENIAQQIYGAAKTIHANLTIVSVTVHETENCSATYSPDPIK